MLERAAASRRYICKVGEVSQVDGSVVVNGTRPAMFATRTIHIRG